VGGTHGSGARRKDRDACGTTTFFAYAPFSGVWLRRRHLYYAVKTCQGLINIIVDVTLTIVILVLNRHVAAVGGAVLGIIVLLCVQSKVGKAGQQNER
jgi:hypothetical protein